MEAELEQIPSSGTVNLTIQVRATFNFSALAAKRKVGRFVADEIGYLLRAGEPKLVVGQRMVWRVPVTLALPIAGDIGQTGEIDVDIDTGKLMLTPELIDSITQNGEQLASDSFTLPDATLCLQTGVQL